MTYNSAHFFTQCNEMSSTSDGSSIMMESLKLLVPYMSCHKSSCDLEHEGTDGELERHSQLIRVPHRHIETSCLVATMCLHREYYVVDATTSSCLIESKT
jgi:hypothetical protein